MKIYTTCTYRCIQLTEVFKQFEYSKILSTSSCYILNVSHATCTLTREWQSLM